jgi:phage shock protein C
MSDHGRYQVRDRGRYHAQGSGEDHVARDGGRGRSSGELSGEPFGEPRNGDFQAAVARLERAVQELVVVARDRFSDRATAFLDETTQRLENELGRRSRRPRAIDERRYEEPDADVPRRLYRDRRRRKIGGVCAGIARYYGMEPWVVRIIAVTGLLFFPSIVFPAYWIAYFVMGRPPGRGRPERPRNGRHGRRDHRSPTPELGARLSPRYSLRNVQADLTEVELRLRRMETHVTSGQYELQRELNKIDRPA